MNIIVFLYKDGETQIRKDLMYIVLPYFGGILQEMGKLVWKEKAGRNIKIFSNFCKGGKFQLTQQNKKMFLVF